MMVSKKMTTTVMVNSKIPVEWDGRVVQCKGCSKWIGWGTTAAGKKMPFDHGDPAFTAHWATCARVKDFKKQEGGGGSGICRRKIKGEVKD